MIDQTQGVMSGWKTGYTDTEKTLGLYTLENSQAIDRSKFKPVI